MENLLKEELFELIEEAGNEIDWGDRKCFIALYKRRPYSFRSRISKYRLCIKNNSQLYFRQGRYTGFFKRKTNSRTK